MRNRSGPVGATSWTSSCPVWAMPWVWATSGDFHTSVTRMGVVSPPYFVFRWALLLCFLEFCGCCGMELNLSSGSPSRGGNGAVVFDINQPRLPTLFVLFLCPFLSLLPFQLHFIPQILLTTLHFLTLFFRSYFCLIGPFNYTPIYESFTNRSPLPRLCVCVCV